MILWNCFSGALSQSGRSSVLNGYPEQCLGMRLASSAAKDNFREKSEKPCVNPPNAGRGFGFHEA